MVALMQITNTVDLDNVNFTCCDPLPTLPKEEGAQLNYLLNESYWLTDNDMNYAQQLLHAQFPNIGGLRDVLLLDVKNGFWLPIEVAEYVQAIHVGGNHWAMISSIGGNVCRIGDSI
jgi:hypothetical protein